MHTCSLSLAMFRIFSALLSLSCLFSVHLARQSSSTVDRVILKMSSSASAATARMRGSGPGAASEDSEPAFQLAECLWGEAAKAADSTSHLKNLDMIVAKDLSENCGLTAEEFCALLARVDAEAQCEAAHEVHTFGWTNDPLLPDQWATRVARINEAVLNRYFGSNEVVVAVIDTGIDYTHEDLKHQMWVNPKESCGPGAVPGDHDGNGIANDCYGANFYPRVPSGDPFDDNMHGSHCAGVIGAEQNNGRGIAGLSANVKLMALKFLSASGYGWTDGAIKCIEYAIENGANIMSNSWGGGPFEPLLQAAIQTAADKGILFVAAAGNYGGNIDGDDSWRDGPVYPCSYPVSNVLCVASTDKDETLSYFSNYGAQSVHVAAPGRDIISTVPGNAYRKLSGTSMATPHVAGLAALLVAEGLSASETKQLIMDSVSVQDDLIGKLVNPGRIDALGAMVALQDMKKQL